MPKLTLLQKICLLPLLSIIFISCKNEIPITISASTDVINARPPQQPPASVIHGVCGYDLDENALIAAGWTKTFEDNFSSDLSKWNVWYGGAFNNELQLYQAGNLSVSNGNLVIAAKNETATGPTTPFDPTQKILIIHPAE